MFSILFVLPMLYIIIKCRIMEHTCFRAFVCYIFIGGFLYWFLWDHTIRLIITTLLEHQFVNALNTQFLIFLLEAFVDLTSLSI